MAFVVEFSSRATRAFLKLPPETQRRIAPKIDALVDDPRPPGCEKLSGLGGYRIRVGDYRIVYEIEDATEIITVAAIGHRRDIYRRL